MNNFVNFEKIDLTEGFWKSRYDLNKNTSIQNVRNRFEESGRFDALRFNYLKTGKKPHIFYDSDVAKWIEGVAYIMTKDPDSMKEHEALIDELVDCMEKAQRDDGYLNSTHQQIDPHLIFQNRGRHELYCAGHLMEAAIAYHKASGKDKLLKIMEKYAECINNAFIVEKSAAFTTPGHEEIELALIKLYHHTGKKLYLDMADYFLKQRGNTGESKNSRYAQDDTNIYGLEEANGHCVRALYLYSGIADIAEETSDEKLFDNLKTVFSDITERKMYITGGVGSTRRGESFTIPYDLPPRTAYNESCCAIALMMFAARMRKHEKRVEYGHLMERVLYNSMLSSTSIDGKSFFYENPLEIALEEYGREVGVQESERETLPITNRVEVFNCSCCPPNINRFFGEFASYLLVEDEKMLTVEQFVSLNADTKFGKISINENYAIDGKAKIYSNTYTSNTICFRIPEWSENMTVKLNGAECNVKTVDGYAYVDVSNEFAIEIDFGIAPKFVSANPLVRSAVGRIALTYGPIVYCLEGADNGNRLNQITVDADRIGEYNLSPDFHAFLSISGPAKRIKPIKGLYVTSPTLATDDITVKFIPYYAFANRGRSDMLVWVRKEIK